VQLVVFFDVQVNLDACPALSDGGVAVNVTEALLGLGGGGGGAGGGGEGGGGGGVVIEPAVHGVRPAPLAPQQVLKSLPLIGPEGFEVSPYGSCV
jgi:hypothetical protein